MAGLIYAGIGQRFAIVRDARPGCDLRGRIERWGAHMASLGYLLRSGNCDGPDRWWNHGHGAHAEIHLPRRNWNRKPGPDQPPMGKVLVTGLGPCPEIDDIVRAHHVNAAKLHRTHWCYLRRNVTIVLGTDLRTPVDLVIYWARPRGHDAPQGGTWFTVDVANAYGIPTYNLASRQETFALQCLVDPASVKDPKPASQPWWRVAAR